MKNKTSTKKVLISVVDTSVQYEKLKKPDYIKNKLITKNQIIRSSFFVLYEYKVGLIRSLIDYYFLVKLYDSPSDALIKISESMKIRELKNIIILQALIIRLDNKINATDSESYLIQLEAAIILAIEAFKFDLDTWLIGNFRGDPIAEYEIKDFESFQEFNRLCNERPVIPMMFFWQKNIHQIDLLINEKSSVPRDFKKVVEMFEKLKADITRCESKITVNKKLGDSVICVDIPKGNQLCTLDKFQHYYRNLMKGTVVLLSK